MNVSHAIPDDIKHFQQAEPEHYFDYTNWPLEICIWHLKFSSSSPKGDLTIFLIASPGVASVSFQIWRTISKIGIFCTLGKDKIL